jgi:hypothetical protein
MAYILQAACGMMCSKTVSRRVTAAAAPTAGLLLLVLLAHLAFMASPLHGAMLHGIAAPRAIQMSDVATPAKLEQAPADETHGGHCRLEWTRSLERLGVVLFMAAAVAGAIGGPFIDLAFASLELPVARALGPPLFGDPQALLQAFRE